MVSWEDWVCDQRDTEGHYRGPRDPPKLILAAAAVVDKDGSPPVELQLAWQHQQWGHLPNGGGVLDQPVGLLNRMQATLNAYTAFKAFTEAPNIAKWKADNRSLAEIAGQVILLRVKRTTNG